MPRWNTLSVTKQTAQRAILGFLLVAFSGTTQAASYDVAVKITDRYVAHLGSDGGYEGWDESFVDQEFYLQLEFDPEAPPPFNAYWRDPLPFYWSEIVGELGTQGWATIEFSLAASHFFAASEETLEISSLHRYWSPQGGSELWTWDQDHVWVTREGFYVYEDVRGISVVPPSKMEQESNGYSLISNLQTASERSYSAAAIHYVVKTRCDEWASFTGCESQDISTDYVGYRGSFEFKPTEVPLPGTLSLLGVGLIALGVTRKRPT